MQAHAAPSRADVENLQTLAVHDQLGCDVTLLGHLRLFEIHGRILEIGAGILPVGIEEQVVEFTRQIVMMLDVGA